MTARKGVGAWPSGRADEHRGTHGPVLPHIFSTPLTFAGAATSIMVAAIALRAIPWLANYPLHRDEALYGYWARLIASGRDPLLLAPWIDKPPLVLYLLAGSLRAFGVSVWALRLPGMLASTLTALAVYGLARCAYNRRTALLAMALVAVSPFAILFAPTAFTDPWLVLWLVLAAWAALAGRSFLAGLALGLAVASKQQGVLGVPLVLALYLIPDTSTHRRLRALAPQLLRSLLGFALILGPVTYWDSLRWVNRPSFWGRSLATYGGLYVAPLADWSPRAAAWVTQLGYLFGFPALSAFMLLLAAAVGGRGLRWRVLIWAYSKLVRVGAGFPPLTRARLISQQRDRGKLSIDAEKPAPTTDLEYALLISRQTDSPSPLANDVDWLLAAYVAGYLALHVIVTFQPWDRYLLPLAPLVSLLAARGIALVAHRALTRRALKRPAQADTSRLKPADLATGHIVSRFQPAYTGLSRLLQQRRRAIAALFASVLALALGYAAWLGAAGRLPVGSDHGAYAGLDQVVAVLRSQPADAVIYDRWLSWHYDFYLYGTPQERRWWDTGQKLADDASHTAQTAPERPQWIVLPAWEPGAEAQVRGALAPRGLALAEMSRIYRPDGARSFTMYEIVPSPAEPAP